MSTTSQLMSAADEVGSTVYRRLSDGERLPINELYADLSQHHDARAVRSAIWALLRLKVAKLELGNILVAA